MTDVATVLYSDYLKFDPADPAWPDRDRFVLSAGHGPMLVYATLHLAGYARPTIDDIRGFRQIGSPDRKSTRLNSSHQCASRNPSSAWNKTDHQQPTTHS